MSQNPYRIGLLPLLTFVAVAPIVIWGSVETVVDFRDDAPAPLRWPRERRILIAFTVSTVLVAAHLFARIRPTTGLVPSRRASQVAAVATALLTMTTCCSGLMFTGLSNRIGTFSLPSGNQIHLWSELDRDFDLPGDCIYYAVTGPQGVVVSTFLGVEHGTPHRLVLASEDSGELFCVYDRNDHNIFVLLHDPSGATSDQAHYADLQAKAIWDARYKLLKQANPNLPSPP